MSAKVSYTAMVHDTHVANFGEQVLEWLRTMDGDSPYQVSRLEHCLQTATRAENDGADDETIACALLHDIGDILAPANHSEVAAAMLAPYVGEKNHWIVKHHGLFQGYYYFHFMGQDHDARDVYRDHPYFHDCVDFCAKSSALRIRKLLACRIAGTSRVCRISATMAI